MRVSRILVIISCHCLFSATCGAQEVASVTVYRGAKILTAEGKTFEPGALVVKEGKILAVRAADQIPTPEGATVRDLTGKVIIPGLVDTHSHLGVYSRPLTDSNSDGNEMTGPVQSGVRALDSINPFDPGMRMAHAGGVTTANIMPGSGNVIGGQTLYVKLRGDTVEEMRIPSATVLGGLKMANGENPKRVYGSKGKAPGTRMKVAALQRGQFVKARDYQRKWDAYRKSLATDAKAVPPEVDLSLEPLVEVLQRKRTVHFHTHRADDIMTTLRLADEFGFELVVQHGTEGFKVAKELAKRNVPVSMTIVDSPGGKAEVVDFTMECGARLTEAGVKTIVNTDDPITGSRFLLRTAALTVWGGLSEEKALQAITLFPAQVMHLEDRVGSLERGKDADFVVLDGPPFSVYTRVLETYIDGVKMFDLSDPADRLYQTGGFAVADKTRIPKAGERVEPLRTVATPLERPSAPKPNESTKELAILAGRIHTVSGAMIRDGVILVRDGKIAAVGPRGEVELPDNVPTLVASDVTPGLIDAYTVVPLAGEYNIAADQDADEKSDPNQADVRVLDAFDPREPLLRYLLRRGVTVVHASPGRANAIAGQTGVFRTHGNTAEAMTVRFPQAMLLNLGNDPKETYKGRAPSTRMGTAALIRTALTGAAQYQRKTANAKDESARPDRDLKAEALAQALEGKIATLICAQRADDIATALRLIDEFKLKGMIGLAGEGYLIADRLAEAKVPVIVHPTMQRVGDLETINTFLGNAAALADRKIPIAICSGVEGYVPKTRVIRYEAAMAAPHGLGFDRALRAVTLDAARILDIEDRFGSIEVGKAADLVLYDGDLFEHVTHVTHVLVDGQVVHDRAEEQKIPFARRLWMSAPEPACCLFGW